MLAAHIGTQHPAAWIFPHKCIAHGLIYNALHWSILQPTPAYTALAPCFHPLLCLPKSSKYPLEFMKSTGLGNHQSWSIHICQSLHGLCPPKIIKNPSLPIASNGSPGQPSHVTIWVVMIAPTSIFHPLPKRPPNSSWETCSTAWGRGGWWDVTGHANTSMPHQCSKPNALPSWNVAWRNHRPRKSSAWACRSLDQGSQSWLGETDQARSRPDEITHALDLRRL